MTIADLLEDHRTGQDETQLGSFVLGGRTKWGTYKQAIRELYKRIRGLRQMITEKDLLDLDIEELKEECEKEPASRSGKRAAIKLRQKFGQMEELERGIKDTKREAVLFYKVALSIKNELGNITDDTRADLDRAEWRWWHLKRAAISKLTTGRVDSTTLKNLCSLPITERSEWMNIIKNDNALVKMLEESEYGRRELPMLSEDEVKLIEQEIEK